MRPTTRLRLAQKDADNDNAPSGPSTAAVKESSRASEAKTPKRRMKGRLSMLPGLPLDVLFEIFAQLRPLDLLHLARTTKTFRRTLMSRSSAFVWKASLEKVHGLPPCPIDLSEPQYVNLAFDHHCHVCGKNGIRIVDWLLRVRYCPKCAKASFVERRPTSACSFSPQHYLHRSSLTKFETCYSLHQVNDLEAKFYALRDDEAALAALKDKLKIYMRVAYPHSALCYKWAVKCALARLETLRNRQRDRSAAIMQRLRDLGWGDELDKMPIYAFEDHPLVKPSVLLTDRIWTNIKGSIVDWMHKKQAARLRCERIEVVYNIVQEIRTLHLEYIGQVLPETADVCLFPAIKEIIDAPVDVVVTTESFQHVIPRLPQLIREWQNRIEFELAEIACPKPALQEEKLAILRLATTVFVCGVCGGMERFLNADNSMHFPWVLAHTCLVRTHAPHDEISIHRDLSTEIMYRSYVRRRPWTCDLELDARAQAMVGLIIEACGMDPAITSTEAMDDLNPRLVCLACADRYWEPVAHTWRTAAQHAFTCHLARDPTWECLDKDVTREVKLKELAEDTSKDQGMRELAGDDYWRYCWFCTRCKKDVADGDWVYSGRDILEHLRKRHSLLEPTLEDIARRPIAPPNLQPRQVHVDRWSVESP